MTKSQRPRLTYRVYSPPDRGSLEVEAAFLYSIVVSTVGGSARRSRSHGHRVNESATCLEAGGRYGLGGTKLKSDRMRRFAF